MKRGIFTEVRYRPAAVQLQTGRREDLIVGPPLRTEKKALLGLWRTGDEAFKTEYHTGLTATESELLKTDEDDMLQNATDLVVYIKHSIDGYIDLTDSNHVLVPLTIDADAYNDNTESSNHIIEMDPMNGLYIKETGSGNTTVVAPVTGTGTLINPQTPGTIVSRSGSGVIELLAQYAEVGQVVSIDGEIGIIIGVSSDTISFAYGNIPLADQLAAGDKTADVILCEDIGRCVVGGGGVRLYFDIRVLRPSAVGRHYISEMQDLYDLLGYGSVQDPDSLLAYDAGLYGGLSQLKFYLYAYDLDNISTDTPEEFCYDSGQYFSTINIIRGWNFYHVLPVYRIPCATDSGAIDNIEAMMQSYSTMISTRSAPKGRKEGRIYVALPILNEGKGYDLTQDDKGTDYENTSYTAFNDYQAAIDKPALYLSNRVTLVDAYAWLGSQFIEGSTVAVCFAAKRARLSSRDGVNLGYSTTNDVVEGITSIPWMDYLDDDQIDDLADFGWQLLVRESHTAAPRIFHQVTTDTSIPAKMEEHHTVALDAMCQTIRRTLRPLLARGYENVISDDPTAEKTAQYLRKLNLSIAGIRSHYVDVLRIFSKIEVVALRPDEDNPSRMIAEVNLDLYHPVNAIHFIIWV